MANCICALLPLVALELACSQSVAGRATATAGALAVTGAAASMADNTCYESSSDDPTVRSRNSFCTGTSGGADPKAAGAVLGFGLAAILAGRAIELNAQENAGTHPTTAVSGTLPGQAQQELPVAPAPADPTASSGTPSSPANSPSAAPVGPTRESAARAIEERAQNASKPPPPPPASPSLPAKPPK